MSRYTGPSTKKDRRFGLLPESPTEVKKPYRRRKSNYGIQLEEKQKLRHIYGLQEKQFRRYFRQAQKQPSNTGYVLLQQLECRLDNIVYRLGFVKTRRAARQLVAHGHVRVNDRKVDIPSYLVKIGEVITLTDTARSNVFIKEMIETTKDEQVAEWLKRKSGVGVVESLPVPDQLRQDIDLQLIVEYYSR